MPGGAPASTAQVLSLAKDPTNMSWVKMSSRVVFGTEKGPEKSMCGPRRGEIRRNRREGRGVVRWLGWDGKEEGGASPLKPIPGVEGSQGVKRQGRVR